jgi:EmrB/QacA subfamily drug resistance transporter
VTATSPDLTPSRRWVILGTCCLSLLIVSLDLTVLNVALPSLASDLGADVSGLQWVIDAYVLVLAALLVLAGSTADRIGRRRVFQAGLVVFTASSLLCSVAPSLPWLIAFRVLQGVGASMLNPVAMSIITNTFPERRERARAIGVWGGVVGVSMALGPVAGGLLVGGISWRAIFWINIPVGIAALLLTRRFVPESKAARARALDPVGQLLMVAALAGVTAAIIEGPRLGWTRWPTLLLAGTGASALACLVRYELRRRDPLLEIRFFRSIPFSGASLIAISAFGAISGFLFLNTLYLQEVRGMSALGAGLYTLPMAAVTVIAAPLSGRLVGSRGPRPSLVIAGVLMTTGGLMLTRTGVSTPAAWLFVAYVLFGIGFGVVNAPITTTAVSGMPVSQAGVAAAIASTSRSVGQLLGVAVIGTVIGAAGTAGGVATGLAGQVLAGSATGWWIVTGCGAAVLLLGLATTGSRGRASADRTAAWLADRPGSAPDPAPAVVTG